MTIPGIYSQRDNRWSGYELGFNNDPAFNIYHYGCLVTAIANLIWETGNPNADPGAVNNWLKNNGGFVAGGGNLIWDAVNPLLAQTNVHSAGYSSNLSAVNAFLEDENNYAIIQLTKAGFPMHFSVSPYVGMIADSWDAVLKPTTSYSFVGAHLYTKTVTPPVPVNTTPPPVAAPTIPAPTIPAPTPEPVPTVTEPQPDPNPPVPTDTHPNPPVPTDPLTPYGFVPSVEHLVIKRSGAYAIDIVTNTKVQDITNGTPIETSGFLTYATHKYYRTKWSLDNLKSTVIPSDFFDEPTGYPDGPVTTRIVTPPITTGNDPVHVPSFWEQFKTSPLGTLIRHIFARRS